MEVWCTRIRFYALIHFIQTPRSFLLARYIRPMPMPGIEIGDCDSRSPDVEVGGRAGWGRNSDQASFFELGRILRFRHSGTLYDL